MPLKKATAGNTEGARKWLDALLLAVAKQATKRLRNSGQPGAWATPGVSRTWAASWLGVPAGTIYAWTNGRGGPTLAQALQWSKDYNIPLDNFGLHAAALAADRRAAGEHAENVYEASIDALGDDDGDNIPF